MLRAECSEVVHELTSLYLLSQELQKVGVTRGELRDHLVDKVLLLLGFHRHHPPPSPDSVYRACYTVNAPVWLVLPLSAAFTPVGQPPLGQLDRGRRSPLRGLLKGLQRKKDLAEPPLGGTQDAVCVPAARNAHFPDVTAQVARSSEPTSPHHLHLRENRAG